MEGSLGTGLMAVFAVSGSVVFIALQAHKRLLSDFMKKIEFEIGSKDHQKKKVRFANNVVEHSSQHYKAYHHKKPMPSRPPAAANHHNQVADQKLEVLPLNWQVLYKGIIESRGFRDLN